MNSGHDNLARDYAALDDAELVRRVQAGEHAAFRAIMQRCNQRMFRVVRGVIHDEAEAEDVVQDAYVRAYEHIGGFRGESSLPTWLTRIALNEAYARLRRRRETVDIEQTQLTTADASNVLAFPGTGEDPLETAARSQLRHLLEQAIDALPEAFGLVYVLREIEGCSVEETAAALQLREETVKTRLHRARRLLRAALAERVAAASADAFLFMGARCARTTEAVMARIAAMPPHT